MPIHYSPRSATDVDHSMEDILYEFRRQDKTWTQTNYGPGLYACTERRMSGQDIGQFHKRKKNGELLPFTHWFQFESSGSSRGVWNRETVAGGYHWFDRYVNENGYIWRAEWHLTPEIVGEHAPSDLSRYVTQAAASIYAQGWDAATFLAELTQVHHMFASVAKTLARLIRQGKVPVGWRSMTSAWLQLRYGWRPLINDIKNIIDLVDEIGKERRKRHKSKAYGSWTDNVNSYENDIAGGDGSIRYLSIADRISISPRACVVGDIVVPAIQLNPIQTGWELIPFSFVIDWFINVGKTIGALSFLSRAEAYVACAGYQISMERTLEYGVYSADSTWISWDCKQEGEASANLVRRIPSSIPIVPRIAVNINVTKIIDSVALVLQQLRRL